MCRSLQQLLDQCAACVLQPMTGFLLLLSQSSGLFVGYVWHAANNIVSSLKHHLYQQFFGAPMRIPHTTHTQPLRTPGTLVSACPDS
jgi:hypothetical protein